MFLAGAALATSALVAACSRNGESASTTTPPTPEPSHWHDEGEAGPQRWGELDPAYATCSTGRMQSPIDIVNPSPSGKTSPTLGYRRAPANVVNNGHRAPKASSGWWPATRWCSARRRSWRSPTPMPTTAVLASPSTGGR